MHVLRAGRHTGLFDENLRPDQDYFRFESDFLAFAAAIDVLLQALTQLEDEIVAEIQAQAEEDSADAGPYSDEDARNEVQRQPRSVTNPLD